MTRVVWDTDADQEPPPGWDPELALMDSLLASAEGRPINEVEVEMASYAMAAAAIMSRGVEQEQAMEIVLQVSKNGTIHVTYSTEDGLGVTISRGEDSDVPA